MNHNNPEIGDTPDPFREPSGKAGAAGSTDDLLIPIRSSAGVQPVFLAIGGPAEPAAYYKFRMLAAKSPGSLQVIGLRDPEAIEPLRRVC